MPFEEHPVSANLSALGLQGATASRKPVSGQSINFDSSVTTSPFVGTNRLDRRATRRSSRLVSSGDSIFQTVHLP